MRFDQETLGHIDRLIRQRPVSEGVLTPFRDLVGLMIGNAPEIKPLDREERFQQPKREHGFPLFSREDLPLDVDSASDLFRSFLRHLASTDRADKAGLKQALERCQSESQWIMGLFSALLSQDEDSMAERGKEADVDPKVLQFLGHLAMRPSLWALRDLVSEEVDRAQWGQGYCPICGSQPGMAYFSKTGNRYLHCELCGEEWPYPRLQCPFCQNQDQETLGYFHGEQEEGLRVDYCKKCLRYVKTVDQRVFEKATPMEIENLATIHLDLLAEENGFK